MSSKFLWWARFLFVGALVSLFIVFWPTSWFPLQLGKMTFFSILLALCGICFALGRGMFARRGASVFLVGLLPGVYALSWYFSSDRTVGLRGALIEVDTLVFVILAALAFFISFGLSANTWMARMVVWTTIVGGVIAALFQSIVILASSWIPFSISDRSINLIGKWNDLGLLCGLALLLLLVSIEYGALRRSYYVLSVVGMLMFAVLIALIQFPLIWILVLGGSLLIALGSFVLKRTVPWVPLVSVSVAVAFLLWGSVVGGGLTRVFPVSSLEVRPSVASTLEVIRGAHGASVREFLLGSGPQTFGENWLLYKPAVVNQSPFWSLDFAAGFSIILTALGSVGLVGALLWFVPLLLVVLGCIRAFFLNEHSPRERSILIALFIGSVYMWASLVLYVPSQSMVLLAFVVSGMAFGFATKNHVDKDAPSVSRVVVMVGVSVVVLGVLIVSMVLVGRRFLSQMYATHAAYVLGQNTPDLAYSLSERARRIETTSNTLRTGIDVQTALLERMAADIPKPTATQQQEFMDTWEKGEVLGAQGIALYPKDYSLYFSLAKMYTFLATLGVKGAYENAGAAYRAAALYSPNNPQIPLLWARLEVLANNRSEYQAHITRALSLKPDYTDAILLVVQVNLADKDLPNAIIATRAAVKSAPGVAPLWFELGLLLYSNTNFVDAISALKQALTLEPQYANAKYFLGLSYAATKHSAEALAEFEDLQKTNPDNAEVALILTNLRAGKEPFTDAQPPVTATPETRESAPIQQ